MTNGSLMKVESIAEYPLGAFCNTFDLHQAIISLDVFLSCVIPLCTSVYSYLVVTYWEMAGLLALVCGVSL